MDQNQPLDPAQGKPFGGAAFGEAKQVPPPPQTPEVKLRTMQSDLGSIEKTGGAAPTPEFVASPIFKAETNVQLPEEKAGVSGGVKAIIWIVILLIAIGIAAGVYFYLIAPTTETQLATSEPVTTTEPTPVTKPTPPPAPTLGHSSQFGFPNEIIPKVAISDYSIVTILTALQNEANSAGSAGDIREIALVDNNDQQVAFSKFMATLMPELITKNLEATLKTVFKDDFTAFIYFDDKGAWPGYAVETRENVDIDIVTLQDQLKGIETASFSNLFLTPPGIAQEFRTGTVKEVHTNRFAPLSQVGASFNYGLFDGRLIVNTSYGGLLKALELIGI